MTGIEQARREALVTDPMIGRDIDGRYTIVKPIADGGMGRVYVGRQHSLDRDVAIKVLHPNLAGSRQAIKRFEREAHAVSSLRHANTVTIYDFGCTPDGKLYIVMELLEGQPLSRAIHAGVPNDPNQIIDILSGVCASLAEAHAAGIVHRDLKPDNVFLLADESVKVLDFGFVKLLDVAGAEALTAAGATGGTPMYMSPEMAQAKDIDGRSDVYAVGIMLYEMLCGTPPFSGGSYVEVLMDHCRKRVPALETRLPSELIYRPLADLLPRALAKKPDDRYQAIMELSAALEAARPQREVEVAALRRSTTEIAAVQRITETPTMDLVPVAAVDPESLVPWWVPVLTAGIGCGVGFALGSLF